MVEMECELCLPADGAGGHGLAGGRSGGPAGAALL